MSIGLVCNAARAGYPNSASLSGPKSRKRSLGRRRVPITRTIRLAVSVPIGGDCYDALLPFGGPGGDAGLSCVCLGAWIPWPGAAEHELLCSCPGRAHRLLHSARLRSSLL